MLRVLMTWMPARQEVLHVLIAFGVLAAGDVGVGQFVHQGHFGPPGQDRVQVHLLEDDAAVLHLAPGDDLQALDEFGRLCPSMGLHQPHDDIDPLPLQAVAFLEHLPGLADPGPIAEIDLQLARAGRGESGAGS